jgi:thiamine-monophosphate kinase
MSQHEFLLIDWIRQHVARHDRLTIGIGDDAAALRFPEPADCLITTDMLMDGVDFRVGEAAPERIGRKALAVNLSDIAAMAGRPLAAVVAVALPRRGGWELGQGLHAGLRKLADEFGVALAGGDTNTWDGPLVISVTALGEAIGRGPVRRSGARVGDWIMVTGRLGGSLSGHHFDFTPRIREALALHQVIDLHAMIDISDGLAADLEHILDESRIGAILDSAAIPISAAAVSAAVNGRSPLDHALRDGEDFELLFTVAPHDGQRLLASPPFATPITHIGEIVSGRACQLRAPDGTLAPLIASGWRHWFES